MSLAQRFGWLVASMSVAAGAVLALGPLGEAAAAPVATRDYLAVNPTRIVDTRIGLPTATTTRLAAGASLELAVVGRAGVPATGVGAVFVNLTAVNPAGPGFMTVFPAGTARPNASTLNFEATQTVANGALVAVGASGKVVVYASIGSDVLVDIQGYVPDGATVVGVQPARVLDTRLGGTTADGRFVAQGPIAAGTAIDLEITGRGGVPAAGAGAVFLNVTVVDPAAAGFVTVWPAGQSQPNASSLNFPAGQTAANNAFVGLGAVDGQPGRVSIYTSAAAYLIVDVVGYSTAGGPTPVSPARLLDTRPGTKTVDGLRAGGGPIRHATVVDLVVSGRGGVPTSGVGAVAINVTAVEPTATGYISAWPSGKARPVASMLNHSAAQTIANATIVAVGDGGKISLYTDVSTHLIVDVVGWLPGGPTPPKPMFGLNIAPFIGGPPPLVATPALATELTERVAPYTRWIRTYECSGAFSQFATDAHRLGLKVAVGGWISRDKTKNRDEVDCLIEQARTGNADLLIVGTEALRRSDITTGQLIDLINEVAATTSTPVTTSETDALLLTRPDLMTAVDVVFANIEPFSVGVAATSAAANLQASYAKVQAAAGAKPVYIGETGWPTCGATTGDAVPSVENAARYLSDVRAWADPAGVPYFWFEAYDQAWKAGGPEGALGACWGLWTGGGELKRGLRPTFN